MGRTETPIWPKHKDLRLGGVSPLSAPVLCSFTGKGWSCSVTQVPLLSSIQSAIVPPLSFASFLLSSSFTSSSDLTFGTQLIILLAWNLKYGIRYFTCSTWNYCRRILWQVSGLWDSQRIAAALVWCPLNKNNNRHNSLSLHVAHCPSVKLLTKWTSFNSHLHCATTLFRPALHLNFNQDPSTAAGYEGEVFLLLYLFCLSPGQTI